MRTFLSHLLAPKPTLYSSQSPHQRYRQPNFTYACLPSRHYFQSFQPPPSPPSRISSSRCHIFWDLDNVQPTHVEDIPVIGHAMITALIELLAQVAKPQNAPPLPPPQLTVFANPTTLSKFSSPTPTSPTTSKTAAPATAISTTEMTSTLSPDILSSSVDQEIFSSRPAPSSSSSSPLNLHQAVVDILGGTLILTSNRKQSVDFAMKSAMVEYFQEERRKILASSQTHPDLIGKEIEIIIACVSDDTDYVQVLNYLGNNTSSTNNSTMERNSTNSSPAIILSTNTSTESSGTKESMDSTIQKEESDCTTRTSTSTPVVVTCRTISIGEHKGRKRPAWAAPRKLDSLALPAACDAAITLSRPRKDPHMATNTDRNSNVHSENRDADRQWRCKKAVWVNPKNRIWKERITPEIS